jgi:hypothetical protein
MTEPGELPKLCVLFKLRERKLSENVHYFNHTLLSKTITVTINPCSALKSEKKYSRLYKACKAIQLIILLIILSWEGRTDRLMDAHCTADQSTSLVAPEVGSNWLPQLLIAGFNFVSC